MAPVGTATDELESSVAVDLSDPKLSTTTEKFLRKANAWPAAGLVDHFPPNHDFGRGVFAHLLRPQKRTEVDDGHHRGDDHSEDYQKHSL